MIGRLAPLPIEWALFVLYVPASIVSLALLYLIARQLGADRVGAVLFLLLYVAGFRLLTVGSTILHSAELTPAFLALPLQLGALLAFFRERHALAGALAGLAVVVHTPDKLVCGAGDWAGLPAPNPPLRPEERRDGRHPDDVCSAAGRRGRPPAAHGCPARLGASTCPHRACDGHLPGRQLEPDGAAALQPRRRPAAHDALRMLGDPARRSSVLALFGRSRSSAWWRSSSST